MSLYKKVPGAAVTRDEKEFLKNLAEKVTQEFEVPVIVNIGVMWGCSMHCLRAGSESAILYGVDIDYSTHDVFYRDALDAEFLAGNSAELWKTFDEDAIHLLFIDGDHSYEAVSKDIAGWAPYIVAGGIVAFHDHFPAPEDLARDPELLGVQQAVDMQIADNPAWRLIGIADSIIAYEKVV